MLPLSSWSQAILIICPVPWYFISSRYDLSGNSSCQFISLNAAGETMEYLWLFCSLQCFSFHIFIALHKLLTMAAVYWRHFLLWGMRFCDSKGSASKRVLSHSSITFPRLTSCKLSMSDQIFSTRCKFFAFLQRSFYIHCSFLLVCFLWCLPKQYLFIQFLRVYLSFHKFNMCVKSQMLQENERVLLSWLSLQKRRSQG